MNIADLSNMNRQDLQLAVRAFGPDAPEGFLERYAAYREMYNKLGITGPLPPHMMQTCIAEHLYESRIKPEPAEWIESASDSVVAPSDWINTTPDSGLSLFNPPAADESHPFAVAAAEEDREPAPLEVSQPTGFSKGVQVAIEGGARFGTFDRWGDDGETVAIIRTGRHPEGETLRRRQFELAQTSIDAAHYGARNTITTTRL